MIQFPTQSAPPPFAGFDASEPPAGSSTASTAPPAAFDHGAPFAAFALPYGLHPQLRQLAYSAPGGPAGGTATSAGPTSADRSLKEAQAWMRRGVELLGQHRFREAREAFQEGFRTWPDRAFILNEAAAWLDAGHYAEAVLAYERYLGDPDAPRADEARAAMERARAMLGGVEPTAAGIVESERLFDTATQAYRAGRYDEALDAFESAHELNPLAEIRYDEAACLDKLGRRYAAAERYERYLTEAPGAADAGQVRARIATLLGEADRLPIDATGLAGGKEWMQRGNRLLQAGRFDEALAAFREGFRTFPDRAFILNEAAALLDGGRYAEADLAYQRYLSDPDAPRADEARAAQQRAREHLGGREATATGVAESERLMDEGLRLYGAGSLRDALQAFERAHALNPRRELLYNQGACLQRMGLYEQAAKRYEAYLADAPKAADATKVRAAIDRLHAKARSAAQEAFDRGQAMYLQGNWQAAASAFAEAHAHLPLPQFVYDKAAALDKAGDRAAAVAGYQQYLNEAPGAPDASRVRARIEQLQRAAGAGLMQP